MLPPRPHAFRHSSPHAPKPSSPPYNHPAEGAVAGAGAAEAVGFRQLMLQAPEARVLGAERDRFPVSNHGGDSILGLFEGGLLLGAAGRQLEELAEELCDAS